MVQKTAPGGCYRARPLFQLPDCQGSENSTITSAASENGTGQLLHSTATETIDASGPATEQSWIFVGGSEPTSEKSSGPPTPDIDVSMAFHIPIIEVAFKGGMWWSIPPDTSAAIFALCDAAKEPVYTWDWGESGQAAWEPDGAETFINHYIIDFTRNRQTNRDSGRMRAIRVIWIPRRDAMPQWTGELPG